MGILLIKSLLLLLLLLFNMDIFVSRGMVYPIVM